MPKFKVRISRLITEAEWFDRVIEAPSLLQAHVKAADLLQEADDNEPDDLQTDQEHTETISAWEVVDIQEQR